MIDPEYELDDDQRMILNLQAQVHALVITKYRIAGMLDAMRSRFSDAEWRAIQTELDVL